MSKYRASADMLLIPNAVYIIVAMVASICFIIWISFTQYSPTEFMTSTGTTENYYKMLESAYLVLFERTFRVAAVTTIVCAVMAYPIAYFLARATPTVKTIGIFLILMPLMISSVVRMFGWVIILSQNGFINQILASFGFPRLRLHYTSLAVYLGLVHLMLPLMILPLMASIEKIPASLEEAARSLGANWFNTFIRVVLPLSIPGLLSGCILVFAVSLSAFVTPALLGGTRDRMITQQIYEKVLVTFNIPEGAAAAVVLVVITSAMGFLTLRISRPGSKAHR